MFEQKLYDIVKGRKPGRSLFDLSYEKKFSCDMGYLIPVMCEECIPGDFWQIGNRAVVRLQPTVAPVMHEIQVYTHYFFVPTRLIWDDWEDFYTGGRLGTDSTSLPTWTSPATAEGTLWDFFGFPTGTIPNTLPLDFPKRVYNQVYNDYYRDPNITDEVDLTSQSLRLRNWTKDYFTASMPWQQRGTAPALPSTSSMSAFNADRVINAAAAVTPNMQVGTYTTTPVIYTPDATAEGNLEDFLDDKDAAGLFEAQDLRLMFQVQRWLEANLRGGARYVEFLREHFGCSNGDSRLQRAEYIGGSKSPVLISEVLQTSSTDATTPQGNLAGHGVSFNEGFCGKYHVKEHGYIIGIMSILPKAQYQQGINKQWYRESRYDFYFPEFANLNDDAIYNRELYIQGTSADDEIFGYCGRYDEYRQKYDMTCGEFRSTYDYWHLGRIFTSLPTLGIDFLNCEPTKRIFAAPSEPACLVQFGNLLRAFRPMPIVAEPGYIDH